MAVNEDHVRKLIDSIFAAHEDICIDCEACCQQFECLCELVAAGANLAELLPAVEEHLRCCPDCNEEFQALVAILKAERSGLLQQSE